MAFDARLTSQGFQKRKEGKSPFAGFQVTFCLFGLIGCFAVLCLQQVDLFQLLLPGGNRPGQACVLLEQQGKTRNCNIRKMTMPAAAAATLNFSRLLSLMAMAA